MSARILPCRLPFLPVLSILVIAAPALKAETSSTQTAAPLAKQQTGEQSISPSTQPADVDETSASKGGAVNQALTKLYRIPVPKQRSRSEPNRVISKSRMGHQHSDAIRNSISERSLSDPLQQPATGGHIVRNPPAGPAIPREQSLTASNWGPYTNDAYEGDAPAEPQEQYVPHDNQPAEPYRFGFVRGPLQRQQWAARSLARGRAVLSSASMQFDRGLAAFRSGQYRTAVKYFKLSSELNQGDPAAMIYSAHALFAIGRYREGTAFLRKAFALEPRIAMLTYDMRDDYPDKAEFDRQVRALYNAITASPYDMDRLVMLGYVYNYSDRVDLAFKVLTRARAIDPRDNLVKLLYESTNPPDPISEPAPR